MEFTYDGMVRWRFGFYNPNHAAALFAALLPFLWAAWERFPRPICRDDRCKGVGGFRQHFRLTA